MKSAAIERKAALFALMAFLGSFPITVSTPSRADPAIPAAAPAAPMNKPFAKIWHSESTQQDFRVQVSNALFRADWVNLPPDAAKQGASIHIDCRKSGPKWVGTSNINVASAIPGATPGKGAKLCTFTVRFEVESLNSLKIMGHTESVQHFDVKTCHVQQTTWTGFTWVPKK